MCKSTQGFPHSPRRSRENQLSGRHYGDCVAGPAARDRGLRTTLTPKQRLPVAAAQEGPHGIAKFPATAFFDQVLTQIDSEKFAALPDDWLRERADTLPEALALNGMTITADALHCERANARAIVEKTASTSPDQGQSSSSAQLSADSRRLAGKLHRGTKHEISALN